MASRMQATAVDEESGQIRNFQLSGPAQAKNQKVCLCRIGAKRLHPFAQNIFINRQVTCSWSGRTPAFPHQLYCFKLELSTEASSGHDLLQFMKHLNWVSIKPAAAHSD
jgi:hypothetical protein